MLSRHTVIAAYDAAADHYDDAANTFWEHFGRRTVGRLHLRPGMRVLDVCCGSGASAIAAAQVVGPTGFVLGVDLADKLLALARVKAARLGLRHLDFRLGDMSEADPAAGNFDAVVCVFGIVFAPDMASAVRTLWARVRPAGKLALTTWGRHFFEPMSGVFWNAVRGIRPDQYQELGPWDRVNDPTALQAVLRDAGIDDAEVVAEQGEHVLATTDAWWSAVMGSGYRGTIDRLAATERQQVRTTCAEFIERRHVHAVQANAVYAVATRAGRTG